MNADYQKFKNSSQKIHVQKFLSSAREYLPTDEQEVLQTGRSVPIILITEEHEQNDYVESLDQGKQDQWVGE